MPTFIALKFIEKYTNTKLLEEPYYYYYLLRLSKAY
jgi:hypothetical protein